MMTSKQNIQQFTESGRGHLNAGQRLRTGMWALLIFGVVALVVELVFVVRGYHVPLPVLLFPMLVALILAAGCYLKVRYTHHRAVGHMDRFFDLKDGLVTADEHIREGRDEAIHTLQLRHTEQELEKHDAVKLRPQLPRRLFGLAMALLVASVALLFVDDSMAVKQARADAADALAFSEEFIEELEKEFEEILEQTTPEAAELLKVPELKEMIESLEADGNRLAVMRKLSEIDSQMSKMQSELDTRAEENYLKELGEQLSQSKETAALGEALAKGDYGKSAEEMERMQLGEKPSAEKQQKLKKLAARIGETEKSMSSSKSASRRQAQALSKNIQKMSQDQRKNGKSSPENKSAVNQSLKKNSGSMRKVGACKAAGSALDKLRQKLQQGQNGMGKNGAGQGQGQGKGEGAGVGIDRSSRPPSEKSPLNGQLQHLAGQLGEGESERVVEHSDSGSGVASGSDQEKAAAEYQQQVEAFVRREDIPEEMKHGVKTYFKQIHTIDNSQNEGVE